MVAMQQAMAMRQQMMAMDMQRDAMMQEQERMRMLEHEFQKTQLREVEKEVRIVLIPESYVASCE